MVSFRQLCISSGLAFCLLAGSFVDSADLVRAAESAASSQAGSQAGTESSTEASANGASEASRASASEAATQSSSRAVTHSASESGLVGRPTVINRSNVGSEILQAAGQPSRAGRARVSNTRRRVTRTRPAHWKTQVWNQGSVKKSTR